ncbi:unnamed protein product [Orchesella dallaii]|uniref:Uncharacterized protein n=1 Tax=Orchesella dallaii TaxID=48710 RepID=A0ABP1QPP3_9HEXA
MKGPASGHPIAPVTIHGNGHAPTPVKAPMSGPQNPPPHERIIVAVGTKSPMALCMYDSFPGPPFHSASAQRAWRETNEHDWLTVLILERHTASDNCWIALLHVHRTNPLINNVTPIHVKQTNVARLGESGLNRAHYVFTVGRHDADGIQLPPQVSATGNL